MNKQGFISIYAVLLLQSTMLFSFMIIERVKTAYMTHHQDNLDFVEIQAIQKVKRDLLAYEEEDETYTFLNYEIQLTYDDITCYIMIKSKKGVLLSTKLEFDDIEEEIINYTYLAI